MIPKYVVVGSLFIACVLAFAQRDPRYGMIDVNRRPYYSWMGFIFDAMVAGPDGTIYMGQAERKSRLYLYHPE